MAKKRRQKVEKKDDYDFKFPEFDEHQYISIELRKAKISLLAFIFAIVMVIITFQLFTITFPDARGPMVLGIFSVVVIPFLTKFVKMDTSDFDWKNWTGAGAVYIMSWLAIFILVCNPPFSDFIEPEIDEESINFSYGKLGDDPNSWTNWNTSDSPPSLKSPVKIRVSVKVLDNTEIDKDSVKLTIEEFKNNTVIKQKMTHVNGNLYIFELSNNGLAFEKNTYTFKIEAKDIHDHKNEYVGKFEIPY